MSRFAPDMEIEQPAGQAADPDETREFSPIECSCLYTSTLRELEQAVNFLKEYPAGDLPQTIRRYLHNVQSCAAIEQHLRRLRKDRTLTEQCRKALRI